MRDTLVQVRLEGLEPAPAFFYTAQIIRGRHQ